MVIMRVRTPANKVNVVTDYSLMLPQGLQDSDLPDSWSLKKYGEVLTPNCLRRRRVLPAAAGRPQRAFLFRKRRAPGVYVVEHKVQSGTSYDIDESNFVAAS